jgi:hypothetical protein
MARRPPQPRPLDWPKTIGWILIILALLAFWFGAGFSISKAVGMDDNARAQRAEVRMAAFLSDVTGQEVAPRPLFFKESVYTCGEYEPSREILLTCAGLSYPDRIELIPPARRGLALLDKGRSAAFIELLEHETLHKDYDAWNIYNEGVVEALAWDLLPAACWKFLRERCWSKPFYPKQVTRVRTASKFATGRPWKSRAARNWRKDLWKLDPLDRPAAMNAVLPAPLRIPEYTEEG